MARQNLTRQWKKQASAAYGYALARLTLNSYIYMDELSGECDPEKDTKRRQKEIGDTFLELLGELPAGTLELDRVLQLREELREELEKVVAYMDCFRNYEYALNRVERRFRERMPASELNDEQFCHMIMSYITSSKQASEMNLRIQNVIGQLPVRYTRQKYYGMVREALSAYIGSDQEGLDNMMYLLRTAGMVELDQEQKAGCRELYRELAKLEGISFRELDTAGYMDANETVLSASRMLNMLSDYYQNLQEMVNDLYLVGLTRADAVRDAALESSAFEILREILASMDEDRVEEQLCSMEGIQEEYFEKYQRLDSAPEYQEGEEEEAWKLRQVERLMSSSSFMSLDMRQEKRTVSAADVDRAFDDYVQKLDPVLKSCQKPVMRAVMANTLSILPLCFNSLDEIEEYIRRSIGGCSDPAEKEACKELMQELMESEEYEML